MRAFLFILGVLLLLGSLCAFAIMGLSPKQKLSSLRAIPSEFTFSDLVNVAVLCVALFSLLIAGASVWVAIKSYKDSVATAKQQQEALNASRKALETVVSNSAKQQAVLEQSLRISEDQLRILGEQWDKELERQARKPRIQIALGSIHWEEFQKSPIIPLQIENRDENSSTLTFTVRNIGNASVYKGFVLISADPKNIVVERHKFRVQIADKYLYQTPTADLLPYNEAKTYYSFPVDVIIPREVRDFSILFKIFGENLPAQELLTRFRVVSPQ
jgi:hypothetical protein